MSFDHSDDFGSEGLGLACVVVEVYHYSGYVGYYLAGLGVAKLML